MSTAPSSGAAADRSILTPLHLLVLAGLLALPGWAITARGGNWRMIGIYAVALNAVTWVAYGWDKRQAREGGSRTPEVRLHTLELLGGWPAAYLAQRWYRHKTAKVSFQILFWVIVLGYQLVAVDALRDWQTTRALGEQVGIPKKLLP